MRFARAPWRGHVPGATGGPSRDHPVNFSIGASVSPGLPTVSSASLRRVSSGGATAVSARGCAYVPLKVADDAAAGVHLRSFGVVQLNPPIVDLRLRWRRCGRGDVGDGGGFGATRGRCGRFGRFLLLAVFLRKEIAQVRHCGSASVDGRASDGVWGLFGGGHHKPN